MVRIDPVGERVLDLSGIDTARSKTSLLTEIRHTSAPNCADKYAPDRADPADTFSCALSTQSFNTIAVQKLERAQCLHQACISRMASSRCLLALRARSDRPDVILRSRMQR